MKTKIQTISIITMLLIANAIVLFTATVGADEPQPQWPDTWITYDVDPIEDSGKAYRDVHLANLSIDGSYIYLRLECYGDIDFTTYTKVRYKWFIDIDDPHNMGQSGGNVYEQEYLLFVEDSLPAPSGDGKADIFLLKDLNNDSLINKNDYPDYLNNPGPITDANISGCRNVSNCIDVYIKQSEIESPLYAYFTWATDQGDPNFNSAPNLDKSNSYWDVDLKKADLIVNKTASSESVVSGEQFSYTINVKNLGPHDETGNVSVKDTLPLGVNFVSATPSPSRSSGQTYWWNYSSMDCNETKTIILNVNTNEGFAGTVTNRVDVYNITYDPLPNNNYYEVSTDITYSVDLSIDKIDSIDPVHSGGTFSYVLNVTNHGPNTASNVNVTDILPDDVSFVDSSVTPSGNDGSSYYWIFSSLDVDESQEIVINVKVDDDFTGLLSNTATVVSDADDMTPGDNQDTEETTVEYMVDLSIDKTDNADPVIAGNDLTYTINVTNHGPNAALNVNITDTLPDGVAFINSIPAADGNIGSTYYWMFTSLDVDESMIIEINVTVDSTIKGLINNTAEVSSEREDPNIENNICTESTTVLNYADLSITKSSSPDSVHPGDALTYTINVTNHGPNTAFNLNVTDTLPSQVTFVSSNPNASGSNQSTYWWNFASLEKEDSVIIIINTNVKNDATGVIVNTATVTSDTGDSNSSDNNGTVETPIEEIPPEEPPYVPPPDNPPYIPPYVPPSDDYGYKDPTADAGGPYFGFVGEEIEFNGNNSIDNDESGESIDRYDWKFFEEDEWHNESDNVTTYVYYEVGVYNVSLRVFDDEGKSDINTTTVTISQPNRPPENLNIEGPVKGHQNTSYNYNVSATDPDGDNITYTVDWDDETSDVSSSLMSGIVYTPNHMWTTYGMYTIQVSAVDAHGSPADDTTLVVLIDIHFVKDIGNLIDNDSDDTFERFYSNETGNESLVEQLDDGRYLINSDDDDDWDWIYDPETDILEPYTDDTEGSNNALWYFLIILLLICLFLMIYYYLRRKEKAGEQSSKKPKPSKTHSKPSK